MERKIERGQLWVWDVREEKQLHYILKIEKNFCITVFICPHRNSFGWDYDKYIEDEPDWKLQRIIPPSKLLKWLMER